MERTKEQESYESTEKFWGYLVCGGVIITFVSIKCKFTI